MDFTILAPIMRKVILTYQKKEKNQTPPYFMVFKKGWTEMYDWGISRS